MEEFFRFFTDRQKEVYKLREQKMTFGVVHFKSSRKFPKNLLN